MKTKFKKNKVRTHFALSLAISQSRYLGRVRYEVIQELRLGGGVCMARYMTGTYRPCKLYIVLPI